MSADKNLLFHASPILCLNVVMLQLVGRQFKPDSGRRGRTPEAVKTNARMTPFQACLRHSPPPPTHQQLPGAGRRRMPARDQVVRGVRAQAEIAETTSPGDARSS